MKSGHSYIVTRQHVSEFLEPLVPRKGDRVSVGELYGGPEGWPGWYLCSASEQTAGFVPEQIFDRHASGAGAVLEDFTNRELTVVKGEVLHGERQLNGWLWGTRISDGATGWGPLDNICTSGPE